VVAESLKQKSQDTEVTSALFEILETQKIIEGEERITMLPQQNGLLAELLAVAPGRGKQETA